MTTFVEKYASVAGSGTNDGSSAANSWTMAQATASVVAGNRVNCLAGTYIANDSASSAVIDLDVTGTVGNWIEWRAYTTTIGDFVPGSAQPVIIDANTNTLTNGMLTSTMTGSAYNRFIGFQFTGGSGDGVDSGNSTDNVSFVGCKFDNNDGKGVEGDDNWNFFLCEFTANGTGAFVGDNDIRFVACKFHGESANVVEFQEGSVMFSLFYNNGGVQNIRATTNVTAIGNTIDGDNNASSVGIFCIGSSTIPIAVINNIFYDLNVGVDFNSAGIDGIKMRGFNYFSSCNTNYDTISDETTDIDDGTTDPFTNSGTRDYSLATGSNAIGAGADAGNIA